MAVGSCRKQQLATLSMQYAQMNLFMKFHYDDPKLFLTSTKQYRENKI